MTAETIESAVARFRPHNDEYELLTEAVRRLLAANEAALPDQIRDYLQGVVDGILTGLGVYEEPRRQVDGLAGPWSATRMSTALSRPLVTRPDYAWSCGYLIGFKDITAWRTDAEECAGCGRRILTDDMDHVRCFDVGFACDRDCLRDAHESGTLCIECQVGQ